MLFKPGKSGNGEQIMREDSERQDITDLGAASEVTRGIEWQFENEELRGYHFKEVEGG